MIDETLNMWRAALRSHNRYDGPPADFDRSRRAVGRVGLDDDSPVRDLKPHTLELPVGREPQMPPLPRQVGAQVQILAFGRQAAEPQDRRLPLYRDGGLLIRSAGAAFGEIAFGAGHEFVAPCRGILARDAAHAEMLRVQSQAFGQILHAKVSQAVQSKGLRHAIERALVRSAVVAVAKVFRREKLAHR